MSISNRAAHKVEAAKGTVKKFFGRATGDTRMRAEGRIEEFTGNAKHTAAKFKDAFKKGRL